MFVTDVPGNTQMLDGGAMFGNAPRALWEKWHMPDSSGRIKLACRSMLVEMNGLKILCETGVGAFFEPEMRKRFGIVEEQHVLLKSLEVLGLKDQDIDFVFLSHLHFDHAGGLLPEYDGGSPKRLLFPNAKYVTSKRNFERSQNPHPRDRASFIPELAPLLLDSKRLILVDSVGPIDSCLPPHVSFFFSEGHTPGLMISIFEGQNRNVAFLADLIPGISWVHLPITMGYDRYAELVIDEKSQFYQKMKAQPWVGFFAHDPEYCAAEIVENDAGKYVPREKYSKLLKEKL